MPGSDPTADRRLHQIADLLGLPVERFFDEATPTVFEDANECMRLWHRLRTDAGRAAALDYLRRAVDEETP